MLERSRRVVLLIDYDNLQICASRDTPGRDLQLAPVVQLAQRYGSVVLARAYAEWNLSTERLAVYKAGIEPAFAPVLRTESDRSGKSLADTVMVAEGMDMLWTLQPDVVVLATSDKDLIPLVRVAKQRGAFVVVLGSDFTAIPLREMADEHVTYKQLITDATGRYTTEAGPARPPAALPEPSRRRTRERNGREPRAETREQRTEAREPRAETPREPRTETPREPRAAEREQLREPRPEREIATPEPVAPVTSGTPGETDGQITNRRRRRRGSRRRSERIGAMGEGTPTGEAADVSQSAAPDATTLEVAEASQGTVEAPVNSFDAGIPPEPTELGERSELPEGMLAGEPASAITPPAEAPTGPPSPRRRRRSVRAASSAETPAAEPTSAVPVDQAHGGEQPADAITPTTPAPEEPAATETPAGAAPVRRRRRRTATTA